MNTQTRHRKLACALACLSLVVVPAVAATDPADGAVQALAESVPAGLVQGEQQSATGLTPVPLPGSTTGESFTAPGCNYQQQTSNQVVDYVILPTFPPRVVAVTTTTTRTESRPSMAVGINDYGTFGLADVSGVGTGFQMPVGAAHENLAVGWWGEGYLINARPTAGGAASLTSYYPDGPSSGAVQRIDDFYLESDRYVTYRVTAAVPAGGLGGSILVDFEFTVDKERCDVTLRTHMLNQSDHTVDLDYDRSVDWDNVDHGNAGGGSFFGSDWRIDGSSIVASRTLSDQTVHTEFSTIRTRVSYECRTTATGVTMPYAYDIDAWDDLNTVGHGASHVTAPQSNYDGNAGFSYERNGLVPGAAWDTFLVYACSYITDKVTTTTGDVGEIEGVLDLLSRTLDDTIELLESVVP